MEELFKDSPLLKKHIGKCALCGKEDKMSFEHIPPRAAFNSFRAKPVTIGTMLKGKKQYPWDVDGLKYIDQQGGMGVFSLCEDCNKTTGSWYGKAYQNFAVKGMGVVTAEIDSIYNSVEFEKVYPLRFVKQIISMFCSLNPDANIDDLRKFVLDRYAVGIDKKKYKLCMYFTRSTTKRQAGLMATVNIQSGEVIMFSEIVACPFGFLLYIDPIDNITTPGFDITELAYHQYNELCNVKMPLVFREVNNWMPYDYRSKSEIIEDSKDTCCKNGDEPKN